MMRKRNDAVSNECSVRTGKKLQDEQGVTLVELLCCIAIMGLVFSAIVTGMQLAAISSEKAYTGNQKEQLSSTVEYVLSSELRYATGIEFADGKWCFVSPNYQHEPNAEDTLFSEDGRLYYGNSHKKQALLSEKVYGKYLSLELVGFAFDEDSACFTVEIGFGFKGDPLPTEAFEVKNLNYVK